MGTVLEVGWAPKYVIHELRIIHIQSEQLILDPEQERGLGSGSDRIQ